MSSCPRVRSWDCFQRDKAGTADKASLEDWLEPNSCPGGDKGSTTGEHRASSRALDRLQDVECLLHSKSEYRTAAHNRLNKSPKQVFGNTLKGQNEKGSSDFLVCTGM